MKKNKLFVIMGMSSSGKSTLEMNIDRIGYANKIISSTTRIPRSFEVCGKDYWFISEKVFKVYLKQGQYAEHSEYTTVDGKALYGINKNDIRLDEENAVCVVNPDGYSQLLETLGKENVVGIYIKRDDKERFIASLKRDNSDFKYVLEEAYRRYHADKIDFKDIESMVDYVVENNEDIYNSLLEIINIIEGESKDEI